VSLSGEAFLGLDFLLLFDQAKRRRCEPTRMNRTINKHCEKVARLEGRKTVWTKNHPCEKQAKTKPSAGL
jgi:hypothetical protein